MVLVGWRFIFTSFFLDAPKCQPVIKIFGYMPCVSVWAVAFAYFYYLVFTLTDCAHMEPLMSEPSE
jgi:hypothetical protein